MSKWRKHKRFSNSVTVIVYAEDDLKGQDDETAFVILFFKFFSLLLDCVGLQASGSCDRCCSFSRCSPPSVLFFDSGFFSGGLVSKIFVLNVLSGRREVIFR